VNQVIFGLVLVARKGCSEVHNAFCIDGCHLSVGKVTVTCVESSSGSAIEKSEEYLLWQSTRYIL
jgi:hypothetical protein